MNSRFWIIVAIVVATIAVATGVKEATAKHPSTTNTVASGASIAPTVVASAISSVPTATFDTVGQGSVDASPTAITAPALTENQKPEIFYEGAVYCPYCATERWPMAVALSRFGSFNNLKITKSSSTDVYPSTNTLSFYGATYTSQYISFNSVELYTNIPDGGGYTTLQTPTAQEEALANQYDTSGSIPFIDFGGKYVISGATYNPQLLSGRTWTQIAGSLADPNTAIAKGVDGAANTVTAAICKLTNDQPAAVCDSTIQGLEQKL